MKLDLMLRGLRSTYQADVSPVLRRHRWALSRSELRQWKRDEASRRRRRSASRGRRG